jgi:DNA repair exonuclease SbcCD nuclease subunit
LKIALITDTHWGVRNDNQSFLDMINRFHGEVFFPYIKENNIDTVIHLGDIVDRRKYISYTTLRDMNKNFIEKCQTENLDLHILIGNHDVTYKNTNEVNSMNELYNQDVKGYSEAQEVEFDGCKILFLPWINNQNLEQSMRMINGTTAQVVMGHLEIAGCLMQRGMVNDHGLNIDTFKAFDIVMSGHFHTRSITNNIHYLGCPYELTWSDYQDPKGFHIFDTDTRELEFIENPIHMFHKVFYDDSEMSVEDITNINFDDYTGTLVKVIKQTTDNPYWFDLYMDRLYNSNPVNVQVVDDHMNLNLDDDSDIVNEAEDTITILSKYIDGMKTTVDKKKLDSLMRSLYTEALYIEA